ncbi:hypothetical protein [Marinobacter metalliresistant]|uniref:Uncharacterized protein n=1 Tax=Marinobacter metalliresistant TaxID=2961995 RepID=A0ABZ2W355_9GAMM
MSANRGKASHKIRYVEAGGAAVDTEECTFCQSVPDLSNEGGREKYGAADTAPGTIESSD